MKKIRLLIFTLILSLAIPIPSIAGTLEEEILVLWDAWTAEQDSYTQKVLARQKETRPILAKYLGKAVREYFPDLAKAKEAHLVLAAMSISESKLDSSKIGTRGEVGILQCHPRWCMSLLDWLKPFSVRERQRIGLKEPSASISGATAHLAGAVEECRITIKDINDWVKPVSYYGAGTKALRDGRCIKKQFAKNKVSIMKRYYPVILQLRRQDTIS
jgi:hypothetical protein